MKLILLLRKTRTMIRGGRKKHYNCQKYVLKNGDCTIL